MKFKRLCEKQESPVTGIKVHCLDKDYKNRKICVKYGKNIRYLRHENSDS